MWSGPRHIPLGCQAASTWMSPEPALRLSSSDAAGSVGTWIERSPLPDEPTTLNGPPGAWTVTVSYTHLTLPTICSV